MTWTAGEKSDMTEISTTKVFFGPLFGYSGLKIMFFFFKDRSWWYIEFSSEVHVTNNGMYLS